MTREERKAFWVKQLDAWRASGLTQRAYCEREAISLKTFYRWRKKLREQSTAEGRPMRMVPVRVVSPRERSAELRRSVGLPDTLSRPVEIVLSSGRRLRFTDGLEEAGLARLIRMLEVLPC